MICERCGCTYAENVKACPMCRDAPVGSEIQGFETQAGDTLTTEGPEICNGISDAPVVYAGFWIRLLAVMIDAAVLSLFSTAVYAAGVALMRMLAEDPDPEKAVLIPQFIANALMEAFYFIYFHAVTGQTAGKKALGIKVVQRDGTPVGWPRSAIRYLGSVVSMFAFCLGYFWVAVDSRKRGWHDKIADTLVIRV